MALLKVLLLLGLGVSVNSDVSLQKRIIGGQNCNNNERLYHVRITANGEFVCGGSLIHPQWILTAAHCWIWERRWIMAAMLRVHPRGLQVENHIITHIPVVYIDNNGLQHDIMLLRLQRPVTNVKPVPLPNCNNIPNKGDSVQLAGEAATTTGPNNERVTNAPIPPHLQCVDMTVVDCPADTQLVCGREHTFCVQEAGKDACCGDSGGGVIFDKTIYGVISATQNATHACVREAVMMDVCRYMAWINQITAQP